VTRQAPMTHEQAAHVYGALADFAGRYPQMSEGDRAWYRDLARAAVVALAEDSAFLDLGLAGAVDAALARAGVWGQARADVGRRAVERLARAGVVVRWSPGGWPVAAPAAKVTPAVRRFLARHRANILQALGEGVLAG
jgi:hypothetical protein